MIILICLTIIALAALIAFKLPNTGNPSEFSPKKPKRISRRMRQNEDLNELLKKATKKD